MKTTNDLIGSTGIDTGVIASKRKDIITAFFAGVVASLKAGDKVRIPELGTFELKELPERQGRNPATGEPITLASSKNIKFKAASNIKTSL